MKLTFIVWGLVSKNRSLINFIKKIIAPFWSYRYRKDREKQINQYLLSDNPPEREEASSKVTQVAILTNEFTKGQALRGARFFNHLGVHFQLIFRLGDEKLINSVPYCRPDRPRKQRICVQARETLCGFGVRLKT